MSETLRSALKQLRLSGALESLDVRLHEASGNALNPAEFLELLLQDELAVRSDRQVRRRVKAAQFRELARYLKPDLLIIDDMGMKQLPKHSGEYLFEIVMRRYETRSTVMTSNRPLEDWGKLIGDVPSATAILDRFLHHAELVTITGRSYRLRHAATKTTEPAREGELGSSATREASGSGSSKPAKAPLGSGRVPGGSKPAKAPLGSATDPGD